MTKNLARQIAQTLAQEPLETLRRVPEQTFGVPPENLPPRENTSFEKNQAEPQGQAKDARLVEALERELKDIRREQLFKELQQRTAEGREVYLEEYPELSMDQKQVLKAQAEAVLNTKYNAQSAGLIEPTAKKGRRLFGFGQKGQAEKLQTRVEKPVPPSG